MQAQLYHLEELKAISYFSSSLYLKETEEEVLWDITKNVIHHLGFIDCVIYTLDHERHKLIQRAAYGTKNPCQEQIHNQIELEMGQGIVGSVALAKRAEIVHNTADDPRYLVDDACRLSEISVPIIVGKKLYGVIDSEHPEAHFFNERHLHLLKIVAALCAQKVKELGSQRRKIFTKSNPYFKRLENMMRIKKIYRDPCLSLGNTAERLGISACYLSSLVNSLLQKSFNDFVNEYRIEDVKENLGSDSFSHYTVVSVGLEAGFNSKSAFYAAFKKHTGITPVQFKNSLLGMA
ncbi:helix-turn-helix domain-containing protein [Sediminicola luteus]|uniref:HTH araC/xylS-type domain-containing protein n=1 Tax=Sediminicola luteus TaxID=319238 RepID=A0A2A4GEI4_9FLAO|nr:helix-turn-helix domain-containing protein [Sediminicola luteus]PCE66424.1 hypothetical protein B7P33_03770 [Sediminicola luteus]